MSADRGTLSRGAPPAPHDNSGRQAPTAPGGRRPPSAPRERKPALAALAILLIVGGALGAAYLVIQNNHRVAAIEITQQIGIGQQIPVSAMREVEVAPGNGLGYVPWGQASQVTRFYAATSIPPGTLLSSAMVATVGNLARGREVVGLALKDGQLPSGLQVGDRINIYQVSDSAHACPGVPGSTLSSDAIVLGISPVPPALNDSAIDVRVALLPADAGAVACNAANGHIGIAVLPLHGVAAQGASPAPSAPASSAPGAGGPPAATPSATATR